MFSQDWLPTRGLIHRARERYPKAVLVGGGEHFTAEPAGALRDAPLDFVLTGEGDRSMTDLLCHVTGGLHVDQVPGCWYRSADGIRSSETAATRIRDIDSTSRGWPGISSRSRSASLGVTWSASIRVRTSPSTQPEVALPVALSARARRCGRPNTPPAARPSSSRRCSTTSTPTGSRTSSSSTSPPSCGRVGHSSSPASSSTLISASRSNSRRAPAPRRSTTKCCHSWLAPDASTSPSHPRAGTPRRSAASRSGSTSTRCSTRCALRCERGATSRPTSSSAFPVRRRARSSAASASSCVWPASACTTSRSLPSSPTPGLRSSATCKPPEFCRCPLDNALLHGLATGAENLPWAMDPAESYAEGITATQLDRLRVAGLATAFYAASRALGPFAHHVGRGPGHRPPAVTARQVAGRHGPSRSPLDA